MTIDKALKKSSDKKVLAVNTDTVEDGALTAKILSDLENPNSPAALAVNRAVQKAWGVGVCFRVQKGQITLIAPQKRGR